MEHFRPAFQFEGIINLLRKMNVANKGASSKSIKEILGELKRLGDPRAIKVWERLGMDTSIYYGVNLTKLAGYAKKFGKDHDLASKLWASGIHDARLLAIIIEEPKKATEEQIDRWVSEADFWDLTNKICSNIVAGTSFGEKKMKEWMASPKELVRRAGWMSLVQLAKLDGAVSDKELERYLAIIEKKIQGEANWVKEAMNYCLIAIGSRNKALNMLARDAVGRIGSVVVDYGETSCKTPDATTYLKKVKFK